MDDQCQLNTKIDDDGLVARLVVPKSFNKSELSPELCRAMLLRGGVELAAASDKLLEQFIADAQAASGDFVGIAAQGSAPDHGKDGRVDWLIADNGQLLTEDNPQETKSEDEPKSFYEHSAFTIVKPGDVLGQLHHATHGVDGRDVTGKTLAARDGKVFDFKHDESIIVDQNNMIIAQAEGVFDRSGKIACIQDTIEVDQYVDFNTGNIEFSGNVVIQKGVRDCFKVEAEGDIEVRGLIEAATLIAGGELRALGGFAGREQGSAKVEGTLKAKYLDAVSSEVRGDLMVDREVINCNTKVLGQIDSPRGAIIGGETLVAGAVEIGELGSEGLPITTVKIGAVPHLDPLISELEVIIDSLVEEREKLVKEQETIEKTSGSRVTSTHKERLTELMFEIAEVQTQLDRAEPSMKQTCDKAESMRSVDLKVAKKVYPNTVLVCSGLAYRIKDEIKGPLRIFLDNKGQLKIERDGSDPSMLARQADLSEAG